MYEQSALKNGLRIITNGLSPRDSIGLAVWVRVGGRYESQKRSGVSHFVEHMLFKGTKRRSTKQIKQDVEGVGGMMNAFTSEESTCYFVKIPKAHFKLAFDVLQDMVNHAALETKEFEKEKTVILEEIKMYLDLPAQHVHELMSELLWPNQPLGRSVAGTIDTVSGLRRNDLAEHVRSYYRPNHILITACGEVDHNLVKSLAVENFNGVRQSPPSKWKRAAVSRNLKHNRFRLLDKKTEQTHFVAGFHGLSRFDPARYQLAVLNVILGANMSSRLFEEVRERRGLAYEIKSSLGFFNDTGSLTISAGVEPVKAPLALRVIARELGRLKNKLVPKSELRRAKDYFLGQLLLGLEDTLDQALWYGEHVLHGGELPDVDEICRQVERVDEGSLRKLSKRLFQAEGARLALIGPIDPSLETRMKSESVIP